MPDYNFAQREEIIHKCELILERELAQNPLFKKFPECLPPVMEEYHFYATMFSLSRYINKDLVCKLIDVVNHYVPSSSTHTESQSG